jgi:hypothetical protein
MESAIGSPIQLSPRPAAFSTAAATEEDLLRQIGLARDVVGRGPDAAGGDDDVRAAERLAEDGGHPGEVAADGRRLVESRSLRPAQGGFTSGFPGTAVIVAGPE